MEHAQYTSQRGKLFALSLGSIRHACSSINTKVSIVQFKNYKKSTFIEYFLEKEIIQYMRYEKNEKTRAHKLYL